MLMLFFWKVHWAVQWKLSLHTDIGHVCWGDWIPEHVQKWRHPMPANEDNCSTALGRSQVKDTSKGCWTIEGEVSIVVFCLVLREDLVLGSVASTYRRCLHHAGNDVDIQRRTPGSKQKRRTGTWQWLQVSKMVIWITFFIPAIGSRGVWGWVVWGLLISQGGF